MTINIANLEVLNINPIPILIIDVKDSLVNETEIELLKTIKLLDHRTSQTVKLSESVNVLQEFNLPNIKEKFDDCVEIYTNQLLCIKNKFKMTHSWLTKNVKGSYHPKHNHENNIVSAVCYFNEDGSDDEISPIKFSLEGLDNTFSNFKFAYDISEWNIYNSKTWTIQAKVNQIIVFPGVLQHESLINEKEKTRYCIGTNYFINDVIGPNRQYSELTVNV